MPVLAVKSLPSSTSAFAGSQAAQHKVRDFVCARASLAGPAMERAAAATPINANALVILVSSFGLPALRWPALATTQTALRPNVRQSLCSVCGVDAVSPKLACV